MDSSLLPAVCGLLLTVCGLLLAECGLLPVVCGLLPVECGLLPPPRGVWTLAGGFFTTWEKEMATHSSIFAWKIPWMEEPGGLQAMGSLRVGHD